MINKFLLIIGLVSSLTVQAESAESFCADIVREYRESSEQCLDTLLGRELIETYMNMCTLKVVELPKLAEWLGVSVYGFVENPTIEQQFKNCIAKKKQEKDDNDFLKKLDKY